MVNLVNVLLFKMIDLMNILMTMLIQRMVNQIILMTATKGSHDKINLMFEIISAMTRRLLMTTNCLSLVCTVPSGNRRMYELSATRS